MRFYPNMRQSPFTHVLGGKAIFTHHDVAWSRMPRAAVSLRILNRGAAGGGRRARMAHRRAVGARGDAAGREPWSATTTSPPSARPNASRTARSKRSIAWTSRPAARKSASRRRRAASCITRSARWSAAWRMVGRGQWAPEDMQQGAGGTRPVGARLQRPAARPLFRRGDLPLDEDFARLGAAFPRLRAGGEAVGARAKIAMRSPGSA